MLVQMLVAGIATLSFSVMFSAPRKEIFLCGVTGGVGWVVYLLGYSMVSSVIIATFGGAMAITLLSRIFAVNRCVPVIIFLSAGIFPLVPGSGIYFTTYYTFMDDRNLAWHYGRESLGIALAIAFGIMLVFLIPQKWFNLRPGKKKNLIDKWY